MASDMRGSADVWTAEYTNTRLETFFVASHTSDLSGPTEALLAYLRRHSKRLLAVLNPLEYCTGKQREALWWENGALRASGRPASLRLGRVPTWIADVVVVLWYALVRYRRHSDVFIGCDCLNAAIGLLLRSVGMVDRVVYYSIDWTPDRFRSPLLNWVYYRLDRLAARHSDFVWNVTNAIRGVRARQGVLAHRNLLVPVGTWLEGTDEQATDPSASKVVFLGALERSKGIELVLDAWPRIVQRCPEAQLIVIGKTPKGVRQVPYEVTLSGLPNVEDRGVMARVDVLRRRPRTVHT
jgi:glycosyltransferase involved in cell wall biosynthesis